MTEFWRGVLAVLAIIAATWLLMAVIVYGGVLLVTVVSR